MASFVPSGFLPVTDHITGNTPTVVLVSEAVEYVSPVFVTTIFAPRNVAVTVATP